MKRVYYKKTGKVDKDTKSFPVILFRSRERNRNIIIGNSPIIVSNAEYEILKKSKHSNDIKLYTKKTKLPEPMVIDVNAPKGIAKSEAKLSVSEKVLEKEVKEFMKKVKTKIGIPKGLIKKKVEKKSKKKKAKR